MDSWSKVIELLNKMEQNQKENEKLLEQAKQELENYTKGE